MYTREWLKIVKEVKKLKKSYVNNLILLIIALIWGAAFVAQSAGMDYIGPFTFNSARSILGGQLTDARVAGGEPEVHDRDAVAGKELAAVDVIAVEVLTDRKSVV